MRFTSKKTAALRVSKLRLLSLQQLTNKGFCADTCRRGLPQVDGPSAAIPSHIYYFTSPTLWSPSPGPAAVPALLGVLPPTRFRSMERLASLVVVLLCADGICVGMATTTPSRSFHHRTRAAARCIQHALPLSPAPAPQVYAPPPQTATNAPP